MPSSRREIQIQGFRPQPLKVEKEYSWRAKKLIVKHNQYQPQPLVIYLRSPKIIHVKPQDFRNMVQQLTGKPSFSEVKEARNKDHSRQEQEVRAQGGVDPLFLSLGQPPPISPT